MDREFIKKWQKLLLIFANTNFGRSVLGIDLHIKDKCKVIAIHPNSFVYRVIDSNIGTHIFFTKPYISENIYYRLHHILAFAHKLDINIINPFIPQYNLGCDAFEAYPESDPETYGIDGYVGRISDNSTWSSLRLGSGTIADSTSEYINLFYIQSGTNSNTFKENDRGIIDFNTVDLVNNANIVNLFLEVHGNGKQNNHNDSNMFDVEICDYSLKSSHDIINSSEYSSSSFDTHYDFDYPSGGDFDTVIDYDRFSNSSYNSYRLDYLANKNETDRTLKLDSSYAFGFRSHCDYYSGEVPNYQSAGTVSYLRCYSSDWGMSKAPRLRIEYNIDSLLTSNFVI